MKAENWELVVVENLPGPVKLVSDPVYSYSGDAQHFSILYYNVEESAQYVRVYRFGESLWWTKHVPCYKSIMDNCHAEKNIRSHDYKIPDNYDIEYIANLGSEAFLYIA